MQFICPAQVTQVNLEATRATVEISEKQSSRSITGRLLVAADGGNSVTRQLLGIKTFRMGYDQHAVIANVAMDRPHEGVAYERFTSSGPMALLPSRDPEGNENVFALVWTVKSRERDEVLRLGDAAFLAQLQQRIGERAGRFIKVGERFVYPLGWMQSREHVRQRLAIIGNAAHTLHPVAGQGFNLGLRDVAALAQAHGQDERRLALVRDLALGGVHIAASNGGHVPEVEQLRPVRQLDDRSLQLLHGLEVAAGLEHDLLAVGEHLPAREDDVPRLENLLELAGREAQLCEPRAGELHEHALGLGADDVDLGDLLDQQHLVTCFVRNFLKLGVGETFAG